MIRPSFEGDMGDVLVLPNHLFLQCHIVSPDAPRLCELSREAVPCLHQQRGRRLDTGDEIRTLVCWAEQPVPPHRHAGQQHTAKLMRKTVHNVCQCFATLHTVILVIGRATLPSAGATQLACCHVSTVAVIRAVKGEGERGGQELVVALRRVIVYTQKLLWQICRLFMKHDIVYFSSNVNSIFAFC